MLNPSTADDILDDPTIKRVKGFSAGWGYDEFTVVNLFAYRATDPRDLWLATHPIGADNDAHIIAALQESDCVVAAWGAPPKARMRAREVVRLVKEQGRQLHCLGTSESGAPLHPLYQPANAPLRLYEHN
jgi:hypothetical protein